MAYEYKLLPPLVQDILPPFSQRDKEISKYIKFYFSIGNTEALNSTTNNNIKTIQVMVQKQNTSNSSYLAPTYMFIGTQDTEIEETNTLGDHYVKLPGSLFPTKGFYKIQIRWSQQPKKYFTENGEKSEVFSQQLSEWSKISLIQQITTPHLQISSPFIDNDENKKEVKQISFSPYKISGSLKTEDDSEILKSVNIIISEKQINSKGKVSYSPVIVTGEIAPSNKTTFEYTLKKELKQSLVYQMKISYVTESGYSVSGDSAEERLFISVSRGANDNPAMIFLSPVEEQGKMQVIILIPSYEKYEGNFVIRRASDDTKFTEWEDIQVIQFISQGEEKNTVQQEINGVMYDTYVWEDRTINCGTYYKYGIAPLKKGGWRGTFIKSSLSQACFFDDIYLMGNNKQLRIKFDPTISNLKRNFNESLQTTLGSKYPFVTRNGANNYQSFTLGGLITTYMDTYNNYNVDIYNDSLATNRDFSNRLVFIGKTDYFGRLLNATTKQIEYDLFNEPIFINKVDYDEEGYLIYPNNGRIFNKIDGTPFHCYFPLSFTSKSTFGKYQAFDIDDEIKDFTSKEELFNKGFTYEDEAESPLTKMEIYNSQNDINQWQDTIYEREFRNKVLDFLYQNSIKLFRSNTEGVMLVRLMNISLTPKQELGRMLYSFTADAIEMDEYNIFNCDKYNIQNINGYVPIKHIETIAGTFSSSFFLPEIDKISKKYQTREKPMTGQSGIDILKLIKEKYRKNWKYQPCVPTNQRQLKKMKTFHDMYDFTGETLKSLKIEIYSPPNLIVKHDVFGYSYWYPEDNLYSSNTFADQAISGYLLDLNYEDNTSPKNETSIPIVVKAHLQRKDAFNSDSYVNEIIDEHEEHNYQLETDTYQMDGLQARKDKFIYVGSYSIQQVEKLKSLILWIPQKSTNIEDAPDPFLTINVEYTMEFDIQKYDSIPVKSDIKTSAGQMAQTFSPNEDIIQKIKDNYYFYLGNSKVEDSKVIEKNAEKYQLIKTKNSTYESLNSYNNIGAQKVLSTTKSLNLSSALSTLREISDILAISFDADIGTIVEIQTTNFLGTPATESSEHILNMGYLKLSDMGNDETAGIKITKCIIKGKYLAPTSKVKMIDSETNTIIRYTPKDIQTHLYYPRPGEYIYIKNPDRQDGIFSNRQEVEETGNLIPNGVYIIQSEQQVQQSIVENSDTLVISNESMIQGDKLLTNSLNSQAWIYHNYDWYPFKDGVVECPVDAIINYIYEGGQTTYQLVQS